MPVDDGWIDNGDGTVSPKGWQTHPDGTLFTPAELGLDFHEVHNEVLRGDLKAVRKLLDDGADINEVDKAGRTPLMIACRHGEELIARMLVERKCDIYPVTNELEFSAFHWACGHSPFHTNIARLLLDIAKNDGKETELLNSPDAKGVTPLMKAVMGGNEKTVKMLVERGADKEATFGSGLIPDGTQAYDLVQHIAREKRSAIGKLTQLYPGQKFRNTNNGISPKEPWVKPKKAAREAAAKEAEAKEAAKAA